MTNQQWLAEQFEGNRSHLRSVAYRMLGSLSEAEDAVQESWLRLSRADTSEVENLRGWLTTVVARVCLDILRSRKSKAETPLDEPGSNPQFERDTRTDPELEAVMADSVGLALLVVLDTLAPAERLAFVLHEMFGVPFEEIATIVSKSPAAARQLASRARRRIRSAKRDTRDLTPQRAVVDAFLAALRAGDFEGLMAVLDPDIVVRSDFGPPGAPREIRGAQTWARGAVTAAQLARFAQPALINGAVGLVFAPGGRLKRAIRLTIERGRIAQLQVIADSENLRELEIAILDR